MSATNAGCVCCKPTDDPRDIMARHGSIGAFRAACERAVPAFISYGEAADACEVYGKLLDEAWANERARLADGNS